MTKHLSLCSHAWGMFYETHLALDSARGHTQGCVSFSSFAVPARLLRVGQRETLNMTKHLTGQMDFTREREERVAGVEREFVMLVYVGAFFIRRVPR